MIYGVVWDRFDVVGTIVGVHVFVVVNFVVRSGTPLAEFVVAAEVSLPVIAGRLIVIIGVTGQSGPGTGTPRRSRAWGTGGRDRRVALASGRRRSAAV